MSYLFEHLEAERAKLNDYVLAQLEARCREMGRGVRSIGAVRYLRFKNRQMGLKALIEAAHLLDAYVVVHIVPRQKVSQ